MSSAVTSLVGEIRGCRACAAALPHEPRPVLQCEPGAPILLASQAPGRRVHESGRPFTDASGDRLRDWLGVTPEQFYDPRCFAIVPMGFCYPGTGKSGDLPPRPECQELWHPRLIPLLEGLRLSLFVGSYAIRYHLGARAEKTLTDTVRAWRGHGAAVMALPHPSPRNIGWLKRNPWFEAELLPTLRRRVRRALASRAR